MKLHGPQTCTLCEKRPNTDLFLALTFPHTSYLSVFTPNAGKYEPGITPYLDTLHAVVGPILSRHFNLFHATGLSLYPMKIEHYEPPPPPTHTHTHPKEMFLIQLCHPYPPPPPPLFQKKRKAEKTLLLFLFTESRSWIVVVGIDFINNHVVCIFR